MFRSSSELLKIEQLTSSSSASDGALFTLSYDAAAAAAEARRAVLGARLHSERGVSRLAKDAIAAAVPRPAGGCAAAISRLAS